MVPYDTRKEFNGNGRSDMERDLERMKKMMHRPVASILVFVIALIVGAFMASPRTGDTTKNHVNYVGTQSKSKPLPHQPIPPAPAPHVKDLKSIEESVMKGEIALKPAGKTAVHHEQGNKPITLTSVPASLTTPKQFAIIPPKQKDPRALTDLRPVVRT